MTGFRAFAWSQHTLIISSVKHCSSRRFCKVYFAKGLFNYQVLLPLYCFMCIVQLRLIQDSLIVMSHFPVTMTDIMNTERGDWSD